MPQEMTTQDVLQVLSNRDAYRILNRWAISLHDEVGGSLKDVRARLAYAAGLGYHHRMQGGLVTGFTEPKGTPFYEDLKGCALQALANAKTGGPSKYARVLNTLVAATNLGLGYGAGLKHPIPVVRIR